MAPAVETVKVPRLMEETPLAPAMVNSPPVLPRLMIPLVRAPIVIPPPPLIELFGVSMVILPIDPPAPLVVESEPGSMVILPEELALPLAFPVAIVMLPESPDPTLLVLRESELVELVVMLGLAPLSVTLPPIDVAPAIVTTPALVTLRSTPEAPT